MRTLNTWLMAAALSLGTTSALAQEVREYGECTREATESDLSAAKGAFNAGQVSFNEADYDRAISYWEDAFRRDCSANALLLNLARAYELNGHRRQAVVALETYLRREPDSSQRDPISRRMDVLRKQIEAEPPEETTTTPSETTTTETTTPPPGNDVKLDEPAQPPSSGGRPTAALVVAGVGGAVTIIGAVVYMGGASDVSQAEENCPSRQGCSTADEELGNSGRSKQTLGGVVAGLGVIAIGGGLAWYFLSDPGPSTAAGIPLPVGDTRLDAGLSSDFAGLTLSGTF